VGPVGKKGKFSENGGKAQDLRGDCRCKRLDLGKKKENLKTAARDEMKKNNALGATSGFSKVAFIEKDLKRGG